jgi:hypothetical protein
MEELHPYLPRMSLQDGEMHSLKSCSKQMMTENCHMCLDRKKRLEKAAKTTPEKRRRIGLKRRRVREGSLCSELLGKHGCDT